MSSGASLPARTLHGGRVLCFARLQTGTQRTGKTRHLPAGGEFPAFRGLAIAEEKEGGSYYLVYCDEHRSPLTDTWHRTLKDANHQAEFEYEGVTQASEEYPSEA